jgi:hypothetical protein
LPCTAARLEVLGGSWATATAPGNARKAALLVSQKEHGVLGLGLLLDDQGAADGHDQRNDAVDALCGLFLGGLEGAGEVLSAGYVQGAPDDH